ncbi:MAG: Panacea domain-containing protein, partial [Bacteroidia bacterium]
IKIQKILYYIEAYHLAYFEQPIMEGEFEAWLHGPVSRKVWDHFKEKWPVIYAVVPAETEKAKKTIAEVESKLDSEQVVYIDDILKEFGPRSSYELECLTHEEYPWNYARKGYTPSDRCEEIIPKNVMLEFYKTKLYDEE